MLPCVGVVYHFNPKGVLFEFSAGGSDDVVGIVKPTAIKIRENETIPASANTVELLSKFLQVGDELLCHVEQRANPEKFVYDEEDEEMSGAGTVTKKSKKVEIYPEWFASSAALVTDANRGKKAEFVNESNPGNSFGNEDQYVEALDFDDVLFLDDVPEFEEEKTFGGSATSLGSSKTPQQQQPVAEKPQETPAAVTENKTPGSHVRITAPAAATPTKVAVPAPAKTVSSSGPPSCKDKARLVQLKKPDNGNADGSKVTTAIFEILTGRFANRFVSVASCNIFVFGHNLGIANLMYHLQPGDEGTVEYRVARLKGPQDLMGVSSTGDPSLAAEVPFVKSLWFGTETKQAVSPTKDPALMKWITARKITAKQFHDWIRNALPWKPYLPLPSSTQSAKVIRYLRAQGLAVNAVLLDLRDGVNRGVGILVNTDFYICGINVLHSDLSFFLKPGDSINCQVRPLLNADRYNLKQELSVVRNLQVSHVAYLGYVGPQRPSKADMTTSEAGKVLEDFLKMRGITLDRFESLRKTEKPVVVSAAVPSQFPPGFGPVRPPAVVPMMPGPPGFVARPPLGFPGFGPVMMPPPGSAGVPVGTGQMPPGPAPVLAGPVQRPPGSGPATMPPPNGNQPQPNGAIPGVFGPFIPQVPVSLINIATNLAARAANVDSNDMRIRNLLHNPQEMEIAAKMARNLTEALIFKLQGNLQARMNSNLPGIPELTKQQKELEVIQKSLAAGGGVKAAAAARSASQERGGHPNNSGQAPFKRSGSVPRDAIVKQPRIDDGQPSSVLSRLGPIMQSENSSLDPIPLNVVSTQQSKSQFNPFATQPQSAIGQPGLDSGHVNPFLQPGQTSLGSKSSGWSPTYSRIQDMKTGASASGFTANQTARQEAAQAEKARQEDLQREQQRLWEEYLETKKKKEEQELLEAERKKEAERLAFEAEQNRLRDDQRRRINMEVEERMRQEADRARALEEARRQAELERQRQAELAQARLHEEEKVRKFLAEEKQRKQEEEERMRMEIRRELERKQMEEERQRKAQEEFERRLREEHERRKAQEELERKRKLEEQERLRLQEEMERKRRIEEEERERMRREAERKRLEEQERKRAQEELERKRREEQEKVRKAQEEMERKRKLEEEEKKREEEMEMMWRKEMENKLKKQQEDDERERKMRDMRGNNAAGFQRPAPSGQGSGFQPWAANNSQPQPPKLSGMFGQAAPSNPAPVAPPAVGGFRRSDVFGDRLPPAPNDFWKKFESGPPQPAREQPRQTTIASLKEASRMFQRQSGGGPNGDGGGQLPPFRGGPPSQFITDKNRGNNERRF